VEGAHGRARARHAGHGTGRAGRAGLEVVRRLDGAAARDLGLEPPRGRISWRTAGGEGTLELGGDVPASANLVARASEGSAPLVVARALVGDIDREPGDWRAKELLAAGREEVERIRLVPASGGEVVLVRRGESFDVERPFRDAADRDLVDPLLGDLTGLRAEKFLDAPLAPAATAGLAAGPGRLELALRGRTAPWVIELGAGTGAEGVLYARADGQAVEARTRLGEALARPAGEWRSRSWSGFDSWRAERVRITDAGGKLELVRDQGDWRRDGKKISYTEVGDLLYALTSARAERVASGAESAAYPAAGPSVTAVLADANGAEETLTLYPPRTGETLAPARVSGREVVLLLPAKAVEELRARIAAVRAAAPLEAPAAAPSAAPAQPGTSG